MKNYEYRYENTFLSWLSQITVLLIKVDHNWKNPVCYLTNKDYKLLNTDDKHTPRFHGHCFLVL